MSFNPVARIFILFAFILASCSALSQNRTVYLHTDHLGSPIAATDEGGGLLWREDYSSFGGKIVDSQAAKSNSVGYTGHTFDEGTGLVYAGARHYDPLIGRFMGVDPVGFVPANPQSFNRYIYVNNNPYKFNDPNGEFINFVAKFVVDVGVNAALSYVTTGSPNFAGALKESASGILNPAKTVQNAAKLAKALSKSGKVTKKEKKTYYSKKDRLKAHKNAGGKCEYCGKDTRTHTPYKNDSAEGDHFVPQAKGGGTTPEQLVNSCRDCNGPGGKGSKMPGFEWQPTNPNPRIQDKMDNL
ncbi:MAG: hypothetical protein CME36_06870 [unclassified Hahellaceae]|nr:hypothetical protein [Hahellaceae bacterium]|tara:strand:+ start:2992 stop:3888 length:897 start_codon:yes stop_codon:yes gene_type:complete